MAIACCSCAGPRVEPGETAEAAAAREMEEESGYRPAAPMTLLGLYHNVNASTNRDQVAQFLCREFESVREFIPNGRSPKWPGSPSMPFLTQDAGGSEALDEIFRGACQSHKW